MKESATTPTRKRALREKVLQERAALGPSEQKVLSTRIFSRLSELPEYARSEVVLGYSSFGTEPQTAAFLHRVLEAGKRLVLPRVVPATGGLALHEARDLRRELSPGAFGIFEPDGSLPVVPLSEIDFVLVPGVAFDRRGGRLGYGGGYYDRLLTRLEERPVLAGAAFEVQVVEKVPREPHDVPVDLLVTEKRVLQTGSRWSR